MASLPRPADARQPSPSGLGGVCQTHLHDASQDYAQPLQMFRNERGHFQEVSREAGVLIAPIIPWGISSVNAGFAGTVCLHPTTLSRVFENICTSLAYHGFRRFLVIAGHYENAWPLAASAELGPWPQYR